MQLYTSDQSRMIDSIDRSVANLEQVKSLDDEDYARCLEVFEANSDQRLGLLDWLKAEVLSKMSNQDKRLFVHRNRARRQSFGPCQLRKAPPSRKIISHIKSLS